MSSLKPVRTREDCFNWLTLEEVEREVFGAFIGAKRHFQTYDFAAESRESEFPSDHLPPGEIVHSDGSPYVGRDSFMELLIAGVVWRLEALAERRNVDLPHRELVGLLEGPSGCKTAAERLAHPLYKCLGGEVIELTADQLTPAQRKAIKAGKPVTVSRGAIEGP